MRSLVALALVVLAAPAAADELETDVPTVLSIAAVTYVGTSLVHEGLGHEGGCLAAGGSPAGLSLAVAGCDGALSGGGARLVSVGGATANLAVGGGLAAGLALAPPDDGAAYFALWLGSLVNLYQAGGYLMVGPWVPAGDFGSQGALRGVAEPLPWQLGLSAAGLGLTAGTLFLGNRLAEPLLGADPDERASRQWSLTLGPYLLGSGLVTASSLLGRVGPAYAASAAVATFAGTLFLAYQPLFFSDDFFYPDASKRPARGKPIERRTLWLAAGATAVVLAVGVFGPGVGPFEEPHPFVP